MIFPSKRSRSETDPVDSPPEVAGEMMLVTAAGAPMRKVSIDPAVNCGIIEVDESGSAWRKVWGLRDGARPTSEIDVHILCHAAFMRDTDGDNRGRQIGRASCRERV